MIYHYNFGRENIITDHELTLAEVNTYIESAKTVKAEPTLEDRVADLETAVQQLRSFINSLGKTELVGEGTADNPFTLAIGCELVPNAFYLYEGTRYAYMGAAGTYNGEAVTEENGFAEF